MKPEKGTAMASIEINIDYIQDKNKFIVENQPQATDYLRKSFYGKQIADNIQELHILEVAYMQSKTEQRMRQGKTPVVKTTVKNTKTGQPLSFNDILYNIAPSILSKPLALYNAYNMIRSSGNIVSVASLVPPGKYGQKPTLVQEKGTRYKPPVELKQDFKILWNEEEKIGIIPNWTIGRRLMDQWTGTLTYKQRHPADQRSHNLKLDSLETVFLVQFLKNTLHKKIPIIETKTEKELPFENLLNSTRKEWPRFDDMLKVYKDWKLKDWRPKTGAKMGAPLRAYDPLSSPFAPKQARRHASYLIKPVRKDSKITILDLMASARVAQSVKKGFLYAIIDLHPKDLRPAHFDFYYYPKVASKKIIENKIPPQYLVKVLSEHDTITPRELASIYASAEKVGLPVLICVVSREYGLSNYHLGKLILQGSPFSYYFVKFFTSMGF